MILDYKKSLNFLTIIAKKNFSMKKIHVLFIVFIFLFDYTTAQTAIPGGTVSGNWTASGSPYLIQGSILIQNGNTLTIDPGVTVEFQGQHLILVSGRLVANGTINDSIRFIPLDTNFGWLGIRFNNTSNTNDTSEISYSVLKYAKALSSGTTNTDGGAFFFDNYSKCIISKSTISRCKASRGGGVYGINSSSPIIRNNVFTNNNATFGSGGAVYFYNNCSPIITKNSFSFNTSLSDRGGAIFSVLGSALISENIVSYNKSTWGGGVYCSGGVNEQVLKNYICNNYSSSTGGGLHFSSNGQIDNNLIANNYAINGGGISTIYVNSISIINNTIVNNDAILGSSIYCSNASSPTIINTIMWDNASQPQLYLADDSSDPIVKNCNLKGGQVGIGVALNTFFTGVYTNNINNNPLFNSPTLGNGNSFDGLAANWALQAGSPCINAGDTSYPASFLDIVGNPRIADGTTDIGAYETLSLAAIDFSILESMKIYPNPLINYAIIELQNEQKNNHIQLINSLGLEIKSYNFSGKYLKVDRENLNSGIYYMKFKNIHEITITKKIVVE